MRDLNYQLKTLCRNNRDGAYATPHQRERMLTQIADQLHTLGYRGLGVQSLKPKHTEALVQLLQSENISTGAIKNRLAAIRWWAGKVNRQNVVARSNSHYGIPERVYVSTESKAKTVDGTDLEKVRDDHVRMSLELQQAFGLCREEAIKFTPHYADQGNHLTLKATWTKGGKARTVPIRTVEQRAVLDRAHRLAGRGSLIPSDRNYAKQLRVYERHTANAGLSKLHGFRHGYAQARYEELTGWKAPIAGGPTRRSLNQEEKRADYEARHLISRELGHERLAIVANYLGR